jgi:acyl transferase domain-containing protein
VSFLFGEVPSEDFRALAGQLPAVADVVQLSVDSALICVGSNICAQSPLSARVTAGQVLATLWAESGARPEAVGGAGSGEVFAACYSGVLDEADALALLSWRAGLLDGPPVVRPRVPRVPILSAVVGGELPESRALDPLHWTRDVWEGRRLAEAFAGWSSEAATVLAIGTLSDGLPAVGPDAVPALPPVARLLHDAARLWTAGVPVDWSHWFGGEPRRVPLPAHPLNRGRLRLDEPDPAPADAVPVGPPRGEELKRELARLWSEVLRTEIDRYDRSIFEVDDDSLLAVRLAQRIQTELGVPLPTIDLLKHPTIDRLAAHLDRAG